MDGERKHTKKAGTHGALVLAHAAQRLDAELDALKLADAQLGVGSGLGLDGRLVGEAPLGDEGHAPLRGRCESEAASRAEGAG